jgi:type IV secretory pathway VirB2 component (pilin)
MPVNRKLFRALLAVCAIVAFVAFAYPMYVIRPFRAQGSRELALALVVRSWGPIVASVAAVSAIFAGVQLWRGARWWARALSVTASALTVFFAVLSHINVYELMFHRIDSPRTVPAAAATLENDDMVLAINVAGHARAYPIRMMGYHHIVNDWLGDVPVVATY